MRADNQKTSPARLKALRFAFSVACGIVCLLLVILWARSYWWVDFIDVHNGRVRFECGSVRGEVAFGVEPYVVPFHGPTPMWQYESYAPDYKEKFPEPSILEFALVKVQHGWGIWIPHWALGIAMVMSGVSPWIHWAKRFSLRTLLIATTSFAVVLGLVVYALK